MPRRRVASSVFVVVDITGLSHDSCTSELVEICSTRRIAEDYVASMDHPGEYDIQEWDVLGNVCDV